MSEAAEIIEDEIIDDEIVEDEAETEVDESTDEDGNTIVNARIAGTVYTVRVPGRYKEGHVCTEADARTLVQAFKEAVVNGVAATIRKNTEKWNNDTADNRQAFVDKYAEGYEFGERRRNVIHLDPVRARAIKLATDVYRQYLKAKGVRLKTVSEEVLLQQANILVEKRPEFMENARRLIEVEASAFSVEVEDK